MRGIHYKWFLAPALVALLVFHVIPVASVLMISVTEPSVGIGNYTELWSSSSVSNVLVTTMQIAVTTTVITVFLGLIYSVAVWKSPPIVANIMLAAVAASFWLSVLIRTVAWVIVLRNDGIINSFLLSVGIIQSPLSLLRNDLAVVIGMVHYMLPIAVLPIYNNLRTIPAQQELAAQSMGASSANRLRAVILPQLKPGIVAASALVFMLSLGFFVTPAILGGGKVVMVAEYIKVLIDETVRWGIASTLAVTLLVIVVACLLVAGRLVGAKRILEGS